MRYFVMLVHPQHGAPILMTNGDDAAIFKTQEAAREAAANNPIGRAAGYEVYSWQHGDQYGDPDAA